MRMCGQGAHGCALVRVGELLLPVAVAMSPTGDCVAVQCVAIGGICIYVEATPHCYTLVRILNLSSWLSTHSQPWPSPFDEDRFNNRYVAAFSACGRYVTWFDQRARWKHPFDDHAGVAIDLVWRAARKPKLVALGTRADDVRPGVHDHATLRCIHWTDETLWVMTHKGLVSIGAV